MTKTILEQRTFKEDLKESAFNFAVMWGLGSIASVLSNSLLHHDLNKYNTVDHLAMGVGMGTLAYRRAGGGAKGVVAGLMVGTLFNGGWEYVEDKYVFQESEIAIDTIIDIASVYAGNILGILGGKE